MEPLEVVLKKIEYLRRGLSVEIVIQEEEGHWDVHYPGSRYGTYDVEEDIWVVDKERIAKPDTEKREAARAELQQIYDSSEWYSARYEAGKLIGVDESSLSNQIKDWFKKLSTEITATIKGKRVEDRSDTRWWTPDFQPDRPPHHFVQDESGYGTVPNYELKNKARDDLKFMYMHLPNKDQRIMAGKILGFSQMRIWTHELILYFK